MRDRSTEDMITQKVISAILKWSARLLGALVAVLLMAIPISRHFYLLPVSKFVIGMGAATMAGVVLSWWRVWAAGAIAFVVAAVWLVAGLAVAEDPAPFMLFVGVSLILGLMFLGSWLLAITKRPADGGQKSK